MSLGLEGVDSIIASGTSTYIVELMPIFVLVIGLVISFIIGIALIELMKEALDNWIEKRGIINEFTRYRQAEAEFYGDSFGDFATERKNSKTLLEARKAVGGFQPRTREEIEDGFIDQRDSLQSRYNK